MIALLSEELRELLFAVKLTVTGAGTGCLVGALVVVVVGRVVVVVVAVAVVVVVGASVVVVAAVAKVTTVGEDETARYVASAAFVAVTRHVPAVVALSEEPVNEQPVAVPFVTL